MNEFDINDLKKLYVPALIRIRARMGKLLISRRSVLFHAASLWSTGSIKNRRHGFLFFGSAE